MNTQIINLKFKRPLISLCSGNSYSGKTLKHKEYFKHPYKYFEFSSTDKLNISQLIIISDEASIGSWNDIETPILYKLLTYDTIQDKKIEFKKDSIILFDDLIDSNLKKIKNLINEILTIYCHHFNMNVFISIL